MNDFSNLTGNIHYLLLILDPFLIKKFDPFWRSKVKVTAGRQGGKASTSTLGCQRQSPSSVATAFWAVSPKRTFVDCWSKIFMG